jgi:tRNA threonylcarbamoyladenosine biosynthesis protein TsaB
MSLILGLETSTKICSVAISDGDKLLALQEEGGAYSHSEKLTVFIQEVIAESGLNLNQIDAVAVSKGPGSYTGLRIGVSVAKGLCYALNKPLITVDTLQAMAFGLGLQSKADLYAPMIDARRMEVYTAIYNQNNDIIEAVNAKIIDENSFAELLEQNKILFFGDGAEKCKAILSKYPNAIFSSEGNPSAKYINKIAQDKFRNQEFEDVAYFEPYYLKDFIGTTAKKLL